MARYDVYANPVPAERGQTPYILDIQNDHLGPMNSRVVIPLRSPRGFGAPARDLHPLLEIEGKPVVLDTTSIASVSVSLLRRPVARADNYRNEIATALDTLFGAY